MLFWFGLLVALVAGLLSIGFSREAVKLRFPVVGDYHLDVAAVVLLIFGLALSAVEHYRSERSFRKLVLTSGATSSPVPTAKPTATTIATPIPTATGAAIPKAVSLDQVIDNAKSKMTSQSTSEELKKVKTELLEIRPSSRRYPEVQQMLRRIDQYIDTATKAEKKQRHRKTRRSHLSSKRVKTRAEASERSSGLVA